MIYDITSPIHNIYYPVIIFGKERPYTTTTLSCKIGLEPTA